MITHHTSKTRIAFVIHGLGIGGSEGFFLNLVNGFAKRGIRPIVILLSHDNPGLSRLDPSLKTYILCRKFRYDLSISFKIKRVLNQEGITKVFCVEPYPYFLAKLLFVGNRRVIFYLSLHNSLPITRKKHYLEILYLRLWGKQDVGIFICEFQKKCFSDKYYFSPAHAFTIYNGIDTHHFSKSQALLDLTHEDLSWKESLGLSPEARTILMVGRLSVEKGIPYAIDAIARLNNHLQTESHLILVGTGTESFKKKLEQQILSAGMHDHVHFLGAKKDVRPFLLKADLFTMTSFSETFSLAALEALSMGMPASLSDVGGAAEMLLTREMGELTRVGDSASIAESWLRLLTRPQLREEIARATGMFSLDKMIDQYMGVVMETSVINKPVVLKPTPIHE